MQGRVDVDAIRVECGEPFLLLVSREVDEVGPGPACDLEEVVGMSAARLLRCTGFVQPLSGVPADRVQ